MKKYFLLLLCSFSTLTYAAEFHVAAGESIQSALNQARSGDIVTVDNGVFYESLEVKSGITLQGSGQTILCGQGLNVERGINNYGTVRNMIIELFDCSHDGAGIYNHAGLVEYCIVRGCRTREASIWNDGPGTIRYCVMHNNEPSVASWPNSGGFYNPEGYVFHCTSARNYGHYAGWHSEYVVVNSVSWGHAQEPGFNDKASYIRGESKVFGSSNNATNSGFESNLFPVKIKDDNWATKGPRFIDPTPFAGAPTNDMEIAAMRLADFRLMGSSPLIRDTTVIGAYDYDPTAPAVLPTGITFLQDTLIAYVGETSLLVKQITPFEATNKQCRWFVSDTAVISVNNGLVTGRTIGQARVTVKLTSTGQTAHAVVLVEEKPIPYVCPEVRLADSLYHIEDYTIPSYIPMWVAKEAARKDSCRANLDSLAASIARLQSKYEPYCVVANIQADPATHMAFAWFTNDSINDGVVQLVAKADASDADFAGQDVVEVQATPTQTKALRYAVSTSGLIKATGMPVTQSYTYTSHKALASDLQPGTVYSYRVGFPDHWSRIYSFRTKDAQQGAFSFLYMTDSHLMNKEYVDAAHTCATAAANENPDAKFCIFTGDLVETGDDGNSEWEWERWFEESMQPVLAKMPVTPTDGNHDDSPNLNYTYHFNADYSFNQQSKVKPQFRGITYSFMYGDVLFMAYSKQDYWRGAHDYSKGTSSYLTNDLGNWFREQVSAHPEAKWRVAFVHYNVFSGSGHQDDEMTPMFRNCMLPIMKECEIDVVIQGHDHCYEMIGPVNPDTRTPILSAITNVTDEPVDSIRNITGKSGGTFCTDDGTFYFIGATCGAKRYEPWSREKMESKYSAHKVENYFDLFTSMFGQPGQPVYTRVTAQTDSLLFQSYKVDDSATGTLFNSFSIIRTKEHTLPITEGIEELMPQVAAYPQKFMYQGQLYILASDGHLYTAQGHLSPLTLHRAL